MLERAQVKRSPVSTWAMSILSRPATAVGSFTGPSVLPLPHCAYWLAPQHSTEARMWKMLWVQLVARCNGAHEAAR